MCSFNKELESTNRITSPLSLDISTFFSSISLFIKLKNYLQSTMGQERILHVSIISSEKELSENIYIYVSNIVKTFTKV